MLSCFSIQTHFKTNELGRKAETLSTEVRSGSVFVNIYNKNIQTEDQLSTGSLVGPFITVLTFIFNFILYF